jgi:arylsulfatase A-like enzyme
MSDNGHSEETGNRIRVDNHKSGHPNGHFYGASGGGFTGKWIGHKGNFLEGGIRVPAIISYPAKVPQGETRAQIVTAMDWLPTVMELCQIDAETSDPKLDGHSLLPVIRSKELQSGYKGILHFQWHTQWAVRMDEWKLIGRNGKKNFGLHRLTDEEPERKNYAKENPELVARLLEMHEAWSLAVKPAK